MINEKQKEIIIKFNDISDYCHSINSCEECIFFDDKVNMCVCGELFCPAQVKFCENCGTPILANSRICGVCEDKRKIKQEVLEIFDRLESVTTPSAHESFIDMITSYIYNNYERKKQ